MNDKNHDGRRQIHETIRLHQSRRETWEKEGERPLWKNLSMVGALGWLVVVPTLAGIAAGRWLDRMFDSGVTFTGALIFAGACFGFYLAWRRMNEK